MVRQALVRRLTRAAVVALLAGGCGDETTSTELPSRAPTFIVAEPTASPAATLEVGSILRGSWRQVPSTRGRTRASSGSTRGVVLRSIP